MAVATHLQHVDGHEVPERVDAERVRQSRESDEHGGTDHASGQEGAQVDGVGDAPGEEQRELRVGVPREVRGPAMRRETRRVSQGAGRCGERAAARTE